MKNSKKFHIVRIFCLALCTCMCVTALASCKKNTENTEQIQESELGELKFPIELVRDGKALFTIVTPQDAPDALSKEIIDFYKVLSSESGVTFELTDDYVDKGEDISEKREILIGMTERDESRQVMNEIGYFDSAVRLIGNKIVVAAHTSEGMTEVLNRLKNSLLTFDATAKSAILNEEYTYVSDKVALFDEENRLEDSKIVYPDGNTALKAQAENLALLFKRSFSVSIGVVSDKTDEVECEFLLGNVSRQVLTNEELPDVYGGLIKISGKKIIINGGGDYFSDAVLQRFIDKYIEVGFSDRFNLLKDINEAFEIDGDCVFTKGADVRVMTYNVLAQALSKDKEAFGDRRELVSATILNYMPDIIGLQEVGSGLDSDANYDNSNDNAHQMLSEDIGHIYAFASTDVPEGKSYTTLMYNTNTVKLLEANNIQYTDGSKRIRVLSWGYFEHLESGDKFLVASMHWDVRNNRDAHSNESVAEINKLKTRFNCPIITTGDFNSMESDTNFTSYLNGTSQKEAAFDAEVKGFVDKNFIDHITSTSDAKALFFKTLKTPLTQKASDHVPSYADFKFN